MACNIQTTDPCFLVDSDERGESEDEVEDFQKYDDPVRRGVKDNRSVVRRIASTLPLTKRRKRFRNRSLIRLIGSSLPLKPCRRPYFEILVESNKKLLSNAKELIDNNVKTVKTHVATLADIGRLWDDIAYEESDEDNGTIYCDETESFYALEDTESLERDLSISQISCINDDKSDSKIVALEEELAKLREQIAMIVTSGAGNTSHTDPLQRDQRNATHIPPPPPPPPPPPTPAKQINLKPKHSTPVESKASQFMNKENKDTEKKVPRMNDILQGLGNVKLRSVKVDRSPGGTPCRPRKPLQNLNSTDPADIIANALRKKFAKSRRSFGSPATKDLPLSPAAGFSPTPPPTPENDMITKLTRRRSELFSEPKTLSTLQE